MAGPPHIPGRDRVEDRNVSTAFDVDGPGGELYTSIQELYMTVKPSELRRTLFTVLDQCLETGEPVMVPRGDGTLCIAPVHRRLRVADLAERPGVLVDGDSLDRFSPAEWSPDALS
jgi:hypothetical protein